MSASRPKRPLSVTIVAWWVLLLGIWNAVRALTLARQNALLQELAVAPDPRMRLVLALMWGLLFCVLAAGLWRRRPIVRPLLPLALTAYFLYNLLLLVFYVESAITRQTWPARLALYLPALAFVVWTLFRPGNRQYWWPDREEAH